MLTITEYKNGNEVTEKFKSIVEVRNSCIEWYDTYESIDNKDYSKQKSEIEAIDCNDEIEALKKINEYASLFGYSYSYDEPIEIVRLVNDARKHNEYEVFIADGIVNVDYEFEPLTQTRLIDGKLHAEYTRTKAKQEIKSFEDLQVFINEQNELPEFTNGTVVKFTDISNYTDYTRENDIFNPVSDEYLKENCFRVMESENYGDVSDWQFELKCLADGKTLELRIDGYALEEATEEEK